MFIAPQIVSDYEVMNSVIKALPSDTLGALYTSDLSGVVYWASNSINAVCVPYTHNDVELLIYPRNDNGLKEVAALLNGIVLLDEMENVSIVLSNHNRVIRDIATIPFTHIGVIRPLGSKLPTDNDMLQLAEERGVPVIGIQFSFYVKEKDELGWYMYKRHVNPEYKRPKKAATILSEDVFTHHFGEAITLATVKFLQEHQFSIERELSLPAPAALKDVSLRDIINERHPNLSEKEQAVLDEELAVINKIGFENIFKIVYDYVDYAHISNFKVGGGRGSAANSLVSHLLGITEINPLDYGLHFSRFLNEERKALPDIDLDIDSEHRDTLIEYIQQQYSKEKTAFISVFNKLAIRAATRFTAEKFGYTDKQIRLISHGMLHDFSRVQPFINEQPLWFRAFETLLDTKRSRSVHPAGVIIHNEDLRKHLVIKDGVATWTKEELEKHNYVKFDILSSPTLSFVQTMEKQTGINERDIPLDDEVTFQLLQSGRTAGVFQFESKGMIQTLKEVMPTTIAELADVSAMYRPGPMQFIPQYVANQPLDFGEAINAILHPTRGVIIYQEQFNEILHVLTGNPLGYCDNLRRQLKSNQFAENYFKELYKVVPDFENKRVLFSMMMKMKDYSFAKGHAISYALLSYRIAFYKAQHTAEFLTTCLKHKVQTPTIVEECKELGITIVPPTYTSLPMTRRFEDKMIVGWDVIKGVDYGKLTNLTEKARDNNWSIEKVLLHVALHFPQEQIEALVFSGFLCGNYNHSSVMNYIDYCSNITKSLKYVSFEEVTPPRITELENEYNSVYLAEQQLKYLGFYVEEAPIEKFQSEVEDAITIEKATHGNVAVVGKIIKVKPIRTKKKERMAFIDVFDKTGTLSCVIFPKDLLRFSNELVLDTYVLLRGTIEIRNDQKQLIIKEAKRVQ